MLLKHYMRMPNPSNTNRYRDAPKSMDVRHMSSGIGDAVPRAERLPVDYTEAIARSATTLVRLGVALSQ